LTENHFTSTEAMDPSTGIVHHTYLYKRKPCRRVLLKSKLSRQLAGYALIEKDLRSVAIWLKEIAVRHTEKPRDPNAPHITSKDRDNYNLVKGLFVAALTFYGKCFSSCDGRPVKLERVQLEKKFHRLHDECILYRHNFAAHSGKAKLETADVALVYRAKIQAKLIFQLNIEMQQPDVFWTDPRDTSLLELVEHVTEIAKRKIDILKLKIQTEVEANALGYAQKK
jgi:hypothetical protein